MTAFILQIVFCGVRQVWEFYDFDLQTIRGRSMKEQTTLIKKSHLAKKRFESWDWVYYIKHSVSYWGWRLEMETLIYTVCIDDSMQMFLTDWYLCQSVRGQGLYLRICPPTIFDIKLWRDFNQNHFGPCYVW